MRPFSTTLACLSLLAACASPPPASRLSVHACSLDPGQPEYPDACTQPASTYYGVGDYGYYPPLVLPYYPATVPVAAPTPAKPPAAPAPRPEPKQEPVRHCPLSKDHACP
ncbi:MAG TPA: hypothetical protein VFK21_07090 [Gammaproteobacteria bacterium]|nr:hypothetical protein [Gammaproteobacteria bacterium]